MLFLLAQGSSNNTFPLLGACWGATSRGSQTWQLPEPPRHNCTPPRLKTYCRHLPTPAMACRRGDLFTHSCISKLKFVPFTWPWSLVQTSSLELYPDGGHYFCLIHYYSFQSGPWASWHIDIVFFHGKMAHLHPSLGKSKKWLQELQRCPCCLVEPASYICDVYLINLG